jgi:thymidylate kinase
MTLVSIEGNIGAGKSTLIESLKTTFANSVVFVDEPVDEWSTVTDSDGVTILQKYYADQKRYAFAFQMMAFITRAKRLRLALAENPHKIIVTERCARFCCAKSSLTTTFAQIRLHRPGDFRQDAPRRWQDRGHRVHNLPQVVRRARG